MTQGGPRVVVDPNVFVSAVISPDGTTGQLVRAGFEGRFRFVVCSHLVEELDRVLRRPAFRRYLSVDEVRELVETVEGIADIESDPEVVAEVSRDPADDYLIALATAVGADLVVSGDADLLDIDDASVEVVPPRQLLDRLNQRS